MAEIVPGLRAGARPRDLLGRARLLLLAIALANAAAALVVVLVSRPAPLGLFLAALVAPPVLAAVWMVAYRRRTFAPIADMIATASICAFAMAVDVGWNDEVIALLAAAVFFGAAYDSSRRVLIRTAALAAVALGLGLSDPPFLTVAAVFAIASLAVAGLMRAMTSSMQRYEQTARRQHVLAATGLDLVAAVDMPAIAASAAEGAHALAASAPGVRAFVAFSEAEEGPPKRFKVLAAVGHRSPELQETVALLGQLAPAGQELADQRLFASPNAPTLPDPNQLEGDAGPCCTFLEGEVLVTRIAVAGKARGILVVESPVPVADDLPAAVLALATQVALAVARTDLQRDTAHREVSERFQALIQSSTDVITIISPEGTIRYQSPSARQVFGYEADSLLGLDMKSLTHPDDEARVAIMLTQLAREPRSTQVCECRIRHSDGSWRYTETRMSNLLDVPAVEGIVLNTRDVTDRHSLEAELRHQAFHDALTGLANRTLFANRVEHSLLGAKRDGSTIAVLYCDMQGIKRLYDSLGYTAGDQALVMTADRLRTCVRGQDTVARLGGDEFGVLLDRLGSPSDATMAMERIMHTLRQPLMLPGAQVEVRPNVGIAVAIGGDVEVEDLLRNAAVAMHQARHFESGYALFDPEMHAAAIRRIEVESQLRTAIAEKQFMLHYQPTIDLLTGRLTGVEALVRWQHPNRGIVPPMEFIPLAEESGLIVPLGQWAIGEACRQIRVWQRELPAEEPITLGVNLSGRQLRHPNIVRDIADALDDSGLLPSRLILEITESVLMVDSATTLNRLFQLKSLGVRLAIDDFGTGYSSFAYLRRFPVDILKIDKSFIDGVATEPTASALVDAMIRIGKTLRLETIAEGIERVEQADRLRVLQCDIGQGYLFSRPLPSDAITRLLRERASGPQAASAA
jgi:diguanylate cyclase (GGDEF)-like protein/PAS domain S-box-containing protein